MKVKTTTDCYPFKKNSYEYYFDRYFDIPEGIPYHLYIDEEAHKYALDILKHDRATDTE